MTAERSAVCVEKAGLEPRHGDADTGPEHVQGRGLAYWYQYRCNSPPTNIDVTALTKGVRL